MIKTRLLFSSGLCLVNLETDERILSVYGMRHVSCTLKFASAMQATEFSRFNFWHFFLPNTKINFVVFSSNLSTSRGKTKHRKKKNE